MVNFPCICVCLRMYWRQLNLIHDQYDFVPPTQSTVWACTHAYTSRGKRSYKFYCSKIFCADIYITHLDKLCVSLRNKIK